MDFNPAVVLRLTFTVVSKKLNSLMSVEKDPDHDNDPSISQLDAGQSQRMRKGSSDRVDTTRQV